MIFMKRVADTADPPVVVPVIVVAVDVHFALVVPPIERDELCSVPSMPLPIECSLGCIVFGRMLLHQYVAPSIFMD